MNKSLLPIIILAIVSVIIVAAIAKGGTFKSKKTSDTNNINENETTSLGMLVGKNAIYVTDQAPNTKVFVSQVKLEKPGYVVIHRVSEDGNPGKVIGHSQIVNPTDITVEVPLDEQATKGEELIAMLHNDDGDGKFEFPGADAPVKDEQGAIIMTYFLMIDNADVPNDVSL